MTSFDAILNTCSSEENPSEGPVLHEPTIVLINGEGSDAAVSPQVHHGFATSSSKGCDHLHSQNHDEHHCSREIMYSSAESKSEATYDTLSISARYICSENFSFDVHWNFSC